MGRVFTNARPAPQPRDRSVETCGPATRGDAVGLRLDGDEQTVKLELRGAVRRVPGRTVLDGLDLIVGDEVDMLAVVAPTGAGKTTLLRVLAGLDDLDAGELKVRGTDQTGVHVRKRSISMVYQKFVNYPSLRVFDNIASPLTTGRPRMPKTEIEGRVHAIAEQLGLDAYLARFPQELSGGQQQRLALARALVKEVDLVLLDEPLGNLDYKLREALRSDLKDLSRQRDALFVYATPEPIDALMMASHVAVMADGKILQYGPTRAVHARPEFAEVGRRFAEPPMNLVECRVANGIVEVADGFRLPLSGLPEAGRYLLGLYPHHVHVEQDHSVDAQGVRFDAELDFAEVVGSDVTLRLRVAGHPLIALSDDVRTYRLDETLRLRVDPGDAYLYDTDSGALVRPPDRGRREHG